MLDELKGCFDANKREVDKEVEKKIAEDENKLDFKIQELDDNLFKYQKEKDEY